MFQLVSDHPMIAVSIFMFVSFVAYHEYQLRFRPLFISKSEIETLAAEFIQDHGENAADVVSSLIERAEFRVDPFEQGQWRRVFKNILKSQRQA